MQRNRISGVTSKHFMTCRKRDSDFLFQSRPLINVLRQKILRVKETKLIVFVGPAIKYFSVFMHVPPTPWQKEKSCRKAHVIATATRMLAKLAKNCTCYEKFN